jgi:hypothetical protein
MSHISKRLNEAQVVTILTQYDEKRMSSSVAAAKLGLQSSRFFDLIRAFRADKQLFTIARSTEKRTSRISDNAEQRITEGLKEEKKLIDSKDVPIHSYNYSALRERLDEKYGINVSTPTIIDRAKKLGFYIPRKERVLHERIVSTTFIGELVQHDTSFHLFSPLMEEKLYLITSLDDHSRLLLFADLFREESTWHHIEALRHVFTVYGVPLKYYVDQHSIFRYVKDRDALRPRNEYATFTDDVDPQWKRVMKRCGSDVIYALSPQAKGKVERPYRWLQDRLVRVAVKENLTTLEGMREALRGLVDTYNNRWVHSTTKEIPIVRFENALNGSCTLFTSLPKDIDRRDLFCLTFTRTTDGYRSLSFDGILFRLLNCRAYTETEIRISPDYKNRLVVFRFWQQGRFVEEQRVKLSQLKTLRF